MNPIGEKIKMLRKEKGLSQENLLGPGRNSHVSKIEYGKLKPSQSTLMDIAKELEINFQELIRETDWETDSASSDNKNKVEFGFAPGVANIKLEQTGETTFSPIFYKIYEKDGRENLFCPKSGVPLKRRCSNFFSNDEGLPFELITGICGKPYDDPTAKYCTACGHWLLGYKFDYIIKKIGQITAPNNFATDGKANLLFQNMYLKLIDEIDTEISTILQSTDKKSIYDRFYRNIPYDQTDASYQFDESVRDSLKEKYPAEYDEISRKYCGWEWEEEQMSLQSENAALKDDPIGCLNKREYSRVSSIKFYFEGKEEQKSYFRSILTQIREYGLKIDENKSSETEDNKKKTKEKR